MPDAVPDQSFGAFIKEARQRKGWSQDILEEHSGVSRSTVSRWERGLSDSPEAEHVRAVCAALGIDPRIAAVRLGYLTPEEIRDDFTHRDPSVEEILTLLQDPAVSEADKQAGISYLKYLRDQARQQQKVV